MLSNIKEYPGLHGLDIVHDSTRSSGHVEPGTRAQIRRTELVCCGQCTWPLQLGQGETMDNNVTVSHLHDHDVHPGFQQLSTYHHCFLRPSKFPGWGPLSPATATATATDAHVGRRKMMTCARSALSSGRSSGVVYRWDLPSTASPWTSPCVSYARRMSVQLKPFD